VSSRTASLYTRSICRLLAGRADCWSLVLVSSYRLRCLRATIAAYCDSYAVADARRYFVAGLHVERLRREINMERRRPATGFSAKYDPESR
jgi:hypothetical protein